MKEQGTFLSTNGESTVHYGFECPKSGALKGIVQISHGMCEYLGRYEAFAEFLCDKGYVVCGNDHVGHGKNTAPENLGYFADQDGWSVLADDVYRMNCLVRERYPGVPVYLLGHSMGSFVARIVLTRYPQAFQGVILSGTAGPNPAAGVGRLLAKSVIRMKGPRFRSRFLDKLAFGSYNKRCPAKRTEKDWLTRDQAVVDRYLQDDRCMFLFTASGFLDLFTLIAKVSEPSWAQAVPKKLPILLLSGAMDPVGGYGRGVETVNRRLLEAGCSVSLRLYPEGRHEMLNETNRLEVYEDLLRFLEDRQA